MENQVKKLFEKSIEAETYEELYQHISNNSSKKRKIIVILSNIIELLEEITPLFSQKKFIFFLIALLIKRFRKILEDINE